MKENPDVKKIDIIDENVKSAFSELLDATKEIRKIVMKEIKEKRQFIKNFDTNKNEYIEGIDELTALNKSELEEQRKKYEQLVKKAKERLNE